MANLNDLYENIEWNFIKYKLNNRWKNRKKRKTNIYKQNNNKPTSKKYYQHYIASL
jgi:hypothetical protein